MPEASDTLTGSEPRRILLVTLLYTALVFVLALPLSLHPGSIVAADLPDTHLYIWTLAWDVHAFVSQPWAIFDSNIFHPYANTLAYSENLIGTAFFAAPIIWLTGNHVLAMNLVQLLACVLCGVGAYLLARRVGIGPLGATLSGLLFAFAPPRFFRLGQVHLATIQWIPFGLASLHVYLDRGRRRDLLLTVGFFTLQAVTSGHGAAFLALGIVALVSYRVALGEPLAVSRRLRDLGLTGALLLAPVAWLLIHYRAAQVEVGLRRTLGEWAPSAESFLASPSHLHKAVLSLFTNADAINEAAYAWLFPGYLPVLLAAAAFIPIAGTPRVRLRNNAVVFYGLLVVLTVSLFLRPPLGTWPLVYWLPGFNLIRVPARFGMLTLLALAVLMGAGFDRISRALSPSRRAAAAVVAGLVLVAEVASFPLPATVRYAVDIPAIDRWLNTRPKPFAIAEVPVPSPGRRGDYEEHQTAYMLHAMAHWQKTVHGYSGWRPALHERLNLELNAFPDAQSLNSLRQLGVTYVVVHADRYEPERWPEVEARLARFSELRLEHVEGAGRVYSLVPAP